jgi:sec-independent protein translocase protein TatB
MPSFWDSGFIVLLALLLFGPKKLPVLARQLGKLMGDFRRASNEFRTQMEEELRISEQADRQKQIAAIEAAAPPTPALDAGSNSIAAPENPHLPPPEPSFAEPAAPEDYQPSIETAAVSSPETAPAPLPIASSGDLNIMPPSTGLPIANTSLSPLLDSIPEVPAPETAHTSSNGATSAHSTAEASAPEPAPEPAQETETRPWMI